MFKLHQGDYCGASKYKLICDAKYLKIGYDSFPTYVISFDK
jgi:hypothetical protein